MSDTPAAAPGAARRRGTEGVRRLVVRRVVPVGVVVALVAGTALATRAARADDPAARYRTAAVSRGDVEQELVLTGKVTPVQQVEAAFPVAGTVQSVAVAVGDQVTAGQVVARLDSAPLQRAMTEATAALAGAEAQLETAGTSTSPASSTASSVTTPPPTAAARPVDLVGPQRAVLGAQADVGAALAAADAALASEQQACAAGPVTRTSPAVTPSASPPAGPPVAPVRTPRGPTPVRGAPSPSAAPSGAPTPAPTTAAPGTPMGSSSGSEQERGTCAAALEAALGAQHALSGRQSALATAERAVSDALARVATAGRSGTASSSGSSTTPKATSSAASPGAASAGATGGSAGGGSTASRTDAAQVTVLQAQAALDTAQAALAGATLTAPVTGTVAALPFTVGAPAGTGEALTVVGTGAVRVTVGVPLAQLPLVRVGQAARVTAPGATSAVAGSVEQVSLLPASSTTNTVTYPVTVLVPQAPAALASGASASVAVVLGTSHGVLRVPASALTRSANGTASVLVLRGATATRTPVTTGTVGTTMTQVAGLAAGDRVVLADLDQALPTSSTTSGRPGAGGFGAPGGFSRSGTSGAPGAGAGGAGTRPGG